MNGVDVGLNALVRRCTLLVALVVAAFYLTAGSARADAAAQQKYPDVLAAKVQARASDRFDFDVTISSPYDTPQRYADAFRVLGEDVHVYGERTLFHDHAGEQPFTRDLYGVQIPSGIRTVIVEGRDKTFGYGGKSVEVILPGR